MVEPRFSIITVVRNDLEGLRRTQASIEAQRFTRHQWLVIDGASTDGTQQLCAQLQARGVFAISESDRGIYDAMNKGIDAAHGQYLVFMNAGDTFGSTDTLSDVDQALGTGRVDLLYGDSLERHDEHYVLKIAKGHERVAQGMFASHQAMYFRRAFVGELRYDKTLRVAGDYGFVARLLTHKPAIARLAAPLTIFDLQPTSTSNRQRRQGRIENWQVQRDILLLPWANRVRNRCRYLVGALLYVHAPALFYRLR